MRIIGSIEGHPCKITVFSNDGKFILKFEVGNMEQTYKIKQGFPVKNMEEVKAFADPFFVQTVMNRFKLMQESVNQSLNRNFQPGGEEEFEEII